MRRFFFRKLDTPSKNKDIEFLLSDYDIPGIKFLDVKKASEITPSWYKDAPSKVIASSDDPTELLAIKRCIPVLDSLTSGYFLVTTEDYYFSYDPEKKESYFSGGENVSNKSISMHPISQVGDMPISPEFIEYLYKWVSQWTIRTPKGYSLLFTHPVNQPYLPFYTLSGIVDTDKYPQAVLFPFLMKNNFSGLLPAGTPVVQIIPIKRERWHLKVYNKVSTSFKRRQFDHGQQYERDRFDKNGNLVGGVYKKIYRTRKEYF
jgi:hypothetical protein